MFEKVIAIIGVVVAVFLVIAGVSLLVAWPTMWLWNYLMPVLFPTAVASGAIAVIGYWHAFWLLFLSAILFKSASYKR
jgi:hypothetical protein